MNSTRTSTCEETYAELRSAGRRRLHRNGESQELDIHPWRVIVLSKLNQAYERCASLVSCTRNLRTTDRDSEHH